MLLGVGLCLLFPLFVLLFHSSIPKVFTNYSLHSSILFPYYYHVKKQTYACGEENIVHLYISAYCAVTSKMSLDSLALPLRER